MADMQAITRELQRVAHELLADGRVGAVVGYERFAGTRARPAIIRHADDAARLVFDAACVQNLAVYLTPQKRPARRVGIVAKGCDSRAIVMLVQEQQVDREDVVVIGVACDGVVRDASLEPGTDTMAGKCASCRTPQPVVHDILVGEPAAREPRPSPVAARIEQLRAMDADARFAFWSGEFERCIRCHACRQVCPMCYCRQCIAEKSTPQWIESSATPRATMAWNLIRAFHQAGRCVGCGECERVCPADIPLGLLNATLGMAAFKEFGYAAGMDAQAPTLVGSYDLRDNEDFIM